MTQPDKETALSGLAIINAALSFGTQVVIESMTNPDPKLRRLPDFGCLDRAVTAAEALVTAFGADTPVPAGPPWQGEPAGSLLQRVRAVAERAAPYRPKERRS